MKLHFGHYLVIGMAIYMSYIIFLSTKMLSSSTELVAPDYYEKSMQHDLKQQKVSNYKLLTQKPQITITETEVKVQFAEKALGKMTIYRPSEKGFDKNLELVTNEQFETIIPKADFKKGYSKLKLDWSNGEKDFYTELDVVI
jgi:nitrogen fixation protein FixH